MTDAYDTAVKGTKKTAAWHQQWIDALGGINNVGFYPRTIANYTMFAVGSDYYARGKNLGQPQSILHLGL